MTPYDLPNVTVTTVGNPVIGYTITANDGYCIHTPQHDENEYARIIVVRADYDFSTIQVLPIAELPEGSEIHGDDAKHEVASVEEEAETETV